MSIRAVIADRRLRLKEQRSDGFTLAELVVYSIILVIVIGIAGSLFLTIIRAQSGVRGQAETNNSAQLLYKQLEKEIRNASWAQVSDDGRLLVLQTRVASEQNYDQDRCVSYYYNEVSDSVLRTTGREGSAAALAANSEVLPTVTADWTLARDRVSPASDRAFGPIDKKYGANELIEVGLVFQTFEDKPPVSYVKSVGLRPQGLAEGCS